MRQTLGILLVGVTLGVLATLFLSPTYNPPTPTRTHVSEDDPSFDCETMGNHVCGRVNVETYPSGNETFVRVWDERGRLVLGPLPLERFEL